MIECRGPYVRATRYEMAAGSDFHAVISAAV